MDITLFALYKLGGVSKKVHTEHIAWEAFKLVKERFSWSLSEYRQYPDKMPVLFALEQAKKEKYGRLVDGRAGKNVAGKLDGWRFTPRGAVWIKENEARIAKSLKQKPLDTSVQAKRFIKKIKQNPLYKHFREKKTLDNTSRYMFTDMLVCAPDAPRDIIKQKFNFILATAELIGDDEIITFLKVCEEKFASLMFD